MCWTLNLWFNYNWTIDCFKNIGWWLVVSSMVYEVVEEEYLKVYVYAWIYSVTPRLWRWYVLQVLNLVTRFSTRLVSWSGMSLFQFPGSWLWICLSHQSDVKLLFQKICIKICLCLPHSTKNRLPSTVFTHPTLHVVHQLYILIKL